MGKEPLQHMCKNSKMKKLPACILIALTLSFLSSCHFHVTTYLNVDDIREVVDNNDSILSMSATIGVGAFEDEKGCREIVSEFSDLIEEFLQNASPNECVGDEDWFYQLIDTEIPIVKEYDVWKRTDSLFGILTKVSDRVVRVYMLTNLDKFELLRERVGERFEELDGDANKEEYSDLFDISESGIRVVLNNDQQTQMITVSGVFVNKEPVDGYKVFELQQKGEVEILLFEEGAAKLAEEGIALVFMLNRMGNEL